MDQLRRQVKCAYTRLLIQRWLLWLPWTLTAGLSLAALAIGIDKVYPLGYSYGSWLAAGASGGLLAALVITFWTRPGNLDAAMEVDRRFGLKERVSSALALDEAALATPTGQALLKDAMRRVETIEIRERFGLRLDRWSWLPALPAGAALVVALFVPSWTRQQATANASAVAVRKQIQTAAQQLDKKVAQRIEQAKKEGFQEAEAELKKIEESLRQSLDAKGDLDKKQSLIKLNDLTKELERRRGQLANSQSLKQQLNDLKNLERGPADKFTQALKEGNIQQALRELEKLKQEIAEGKLDDQARQQLAKQLEQMQQKLEQMAQAQQQAKQQLKQQITEKRAAGKNAEADELQRQLDKLDQQSRQMQPMMAAAQKFGECARAMRAGDTEGAMRQLRSMEAQLGDLAEQLAESDLLEQAMDEIAQAKNAMNCKLCNGRGCKACRGDGDMEGPPGMGLGRGRGAGSRPEQEEATSAYDSTVKQKVGRGSAQVIDSVSGPNVKGGVQQEITAQFEQVGTQQADPLTGQRLPKSSQEQARDYFNALREGK